MTVSVVTNSVLRYANLVTQDGVTFWDLLDLPDIAVQNDDLQYSVISTDRIDSIASKFYGDPVLWWVIAAVNDMELVPNGLCAGQVIRIPAPRYVLQELLQQAKVR